MVLPLFLCYDKYHIFGGLFEMSLLQKANQGLHTGPAYPGQQQNNKETRLLI